MPTKGYELGDDRRRDFLFLSLTLITLAIVVWVIHAAIWGIDVRRASMVRVSVIIGVYMALMIRPRLLEFTIIVVGCVLVGDLYSRLLIACTDRWPSFWLNFAIGLALWCATAVGFAIPGSLLTRPPRQFSAGERRS